VLEKLYSENGRTLAVIGISADYVRGMEPIRKYVQEHGVTFPVALGEELVLMNYLGITRERPQYHVPVFFFVGPDGQILEERNPDQALDREWFNDLEQNLEAAVKRLLAQVKPARKAAKGGVKPARKPAGAQGQKKPQ